MKKCCLILLFIPFGCFSQAKDPELKKEALEIIKMSGAAAQTDVALKQILVMIPANKQAEFIIEYEASLPLLYDRIAEIYLDLYTKEDIVAIKAFYNTPVGKKMAANAGPIAERSMNAGKDWSTSLQALVEKYMQP